jgi:GNAT superfamily N-acetyltransferase
MVTAPMIDQRTLARREHENLVATFVQIASVVPGSLITRVGGIALIATGLPLRFFNQVLVEEDDAQERALEAAVAATRARGDRFLVHLRVGVDKRFVSTMKRLGLVPMETGALMPGMALQPVPSLPLAVEPGHEIRRVFDPAGVEGHIHAAIEGFEMPEPIARAIVPLALVSLPGIALYAGYTDGVPVSSGLGVRSGNTIGIYNIATVPSHRRRGYAAAMTSRIAADGAAAGCDVAILQSTEMGRPVYEGLGFTTVVEYRAYIDPESRDEPRTGTRRSSRTPKSEPVLAEPTDDPGLEPAPQGAIEAATDPEPGPERGLRQSTAGPPSFAIAIAASSSSDGSIRMWPAGVTITGVWK